MAKESHLLDILETQGLITYSQRQSLLTMTETYDKPTVAIVVDQGFVSDDVLAAAVSQGMDVPLIDLRREKLDPEALHKIPEALAHRCLAIGLCEDGSGELSRVVFADPSDHQGSDAIERAVGIEISRAVAPLSQVREVLFREYGSVTRRIAMPLASGPFAQENTHRMDVLPGDEDFKETDSVPPFSHTKPFVDFEETASLDKRHAALVAALVDAGVISREDYIAQLRELLSK